MALRKAAECVLGKTWFCGSLPAPGATGRRTGPAGGGVGVALARGLARLPSAALRSRWCRPASARDDGDEPRCTPRAAVAASDAAAASGARRDTLMLLPPRPRPFRVQPRLLQAAPGRQVGNVGGARQYGSMEEESRADRRRGPGGVLGRRRGRGSRARSPSRRRPRRGPGGRSARARTRWSSRPPGRARRWPRSCGRSTSWPRCRRRRIRNGAPGCFTSPRSRRWRWTSSGTCGRR